MPDRFGDEEVDPTYPTVVERFPESGWAADKKWAAEQREAAIANCGLCNEEGYLGGWRVCDHIDHRPAAIRGRKLIEVELEKVRNRKAAARNPLESLNPGEAETP